MARPARYTTPATRRAIKLPETLWEKLDELTADTKCDAADAIALLAHEELGGPLTRGAEVLAIVREWSEIAPTWKSRRFLDKAARSLVAETLFASNRGRALDWVRALATTDADLVVECERNGLVPADLDEPWGSKGLDVGDALSKHHTNPEDVAELVRLRASIHNDDRLEHPHREGFLEPIRTLDELAAALEAAGEGLLDGEWCELPTFGGNEPACTMGVYSWDEHRVLFVEAGCPELVDRDGDT